MFGLSAQRRRRAEERCIVARKGEIRRSPILAWLGSADRRSQTGTLPPPSLVATPRVELDLLSRLRVVFRMSSPAPTKGAKPAVNGVKTEQKKDAADITSPHELTAFVSATAFFSRVGAGL